MKKNKIKPIYCQYCGKTAVLRKASFVHGEKSRGQYLYVCSGYPACDSYVGVHKGTHTPLGTLANHTLRSKRQDTHRIFSQLWKHNIMSKKDAYRWIQDIFLLPEDQAHIGCFSEYRCDLLTRNCRQVLQNHHIST